MTYPYVVSTIEVACVSSGNINKEAAMTETKSVLVIGLDPTLIDFSQPGYPPGMDATKDSRVSNPLKTS